MPRRRQLDNRDDDDDDDDWENPDEDDTGYADDDDDSQVRCPNCRAWMHEDAPQCPQCGEYPTQEGSAAQNRLPWEWTALAVVLLAAFLLTVVLGGM